MTAAPRAISTTRTEDEHPRLLFIDAAILDGAHRRPEPQRVPHERARRLVCDVEQVVDGVRANVRDAARAVLTWLSAAANHHGRMSLDAVLRDCLRPGPDVSRLNYAALAEQIYRTTNIQLSPKRVRTAIQHLRDARAKADQPRPAPRFTGEGLDRLAARLQAPCGDDGDAAGRELAIDTLAAVRAAVGRLITHDFAEHLAAQHDLASLREAFVLLDRPGAAGRAETFRRLRGTLDRHDGSAEWDMKLVLHGAAVVAAMAGEGSLPGVLARLNAAVAGRDLIDTPDYVHRMICLADDARAAERDPQTQALLNWCRRQDEPRRLPSANRVASYALNNAATRILDRVFTGDLGEADHYLELAHRCIDAMSQRDSGFSLLRVTRALELTVRRDPDNADFWRSLGRERALDLLRDVIRYDNCAALVDAVIDDATQALPALSHRLVRI